MTRVKDAGSNGRFFQAVKGPAHSGIAGPRKDASGIRLDYSSNEGTMRKVCMMHWKAGRWLA